MASLDTPTLDLTTRSETGSREMRRLRRSGRVPGILYGGGDSPLPFEADALTLRNTLAHAGAVLQVVVDGAGKPQPVQVKDVQRHAVRGEILHADFVRLRMDEVMQAPITVHVVNEGKSPGILAGGVLTQETNEVTVEALPGDMPEVIDFDASGLDVAETAYISALQLPDGVTLVDDPETVLVSITMPSNEEPDDDGVEMETAVVGDEAQAQAQGDTAEEAAADSGDAAE